MFRTLVLLAAIATGVLAQKQPFDVEALLRVERVSDPQLSPDGQTVAFTLSTTDLEKNTRVRQIYVVPVQGGTPRRLTTEGPVNERPRWSPDSRRIAFLSSRSGSSQIWIMDADGSNPRQVTSLSTEAAGHQFSRDGKTLVFTSEVFPDCSDDACNKTKLASEGASKTKARIYTGLLYRHWNQWQGARRRHLLAVAASGGAAKDLTPGARDVPPFSLNGEDDFAISPDGAEVCFVMNQDPDLATSTNSDLFTVPTGGGEVKKLTANLAADNAPLYSPDGKWIAYKTQTRAGYESDRWRLAVIERGSGKSTTLSEGLDRWVGGFTWSPDSTRLFFTIEDRGRSALHMISATGGASRSILSGSSTVAGVQFSGDGKTMIYLEQSGSRPAEIFRVSSSGGAATPVTRINAPIEQAHTLTPYEEFWVEGAEQARIHGFIVKPPDFREGRKYPALLLIHGGPQGAWQESFSFRWNAQVLAGAGFVVVMPNPRGSTGYGQKFVDDINSDWGGRVYDDLLAVTNYISRLAYVDADRLTAAGGSYGGYMVNWILGHTSRFKALISHAGVFDLRSMAGETEELWFPIWEFKGMPWDNPETYARWSPSHYVKEFRTPTLVTHGELDYRVPAGQGLQLFTALQMQKVPSKLLLFPDEGHWINKPLNSQLWYKTFIDWLKEWTK